MCVRQKLDIVGIKLSLRQWSRFSRDERATLGDAACDVPEARAHYRTHVLDLIAARTDEPAVFLPTTSFPEWECSDRMPEAVAVQAARDGVQPPTPSTWAQLTPLQRFALIKLARSQHENENFVPAMREFGLLATDVPA